MFWEDIFGNRGYGGLTFSSRIQKFVRTQAIHQAFESFRSPAPFSLTKKLLMVLAILKSSGSQSGQRGNSPT